jgi:hypothetical protein
MVHGGTPPLGVLPTRLLPAALMDSDRCIQTKGCVIISQANGGDHPGRLRNILSAKQLRNFSQVRDHLVGESAPSVDLSPDP